MSEVEVKDHQWWERYFAVDGGWERNGGRCQSRLFAEAFTRRIGIQRGAEISILDVGCALGESVRHFSKVYPKASLHGIDFSRTAIDRCRQDLSGIATFEVCDIMDLAGRYDVIYISNVLEHFADFDAKARVLMKHCQRLCILVPYLELQGDQPLSPDPREHHQHTFDDHSFDFLIQEGLAASIRRQVFSCYGAWGWTWGVRVEQTLKNIVRPWIGKKTMAEPRQILYDITT